MSRQDPRTLAYMLKTLRQSAHGYVNDVDDKDMRGGGFDDDVDHKDTRGKGSRQSRYVGVATSYNSMLSGKPKGGRGYQYPPAASQYEIYSYPVSPRPPEEDQFGGRINLYGQDRENIRHGTYNYAVPSISGNGDIFDQRKTAQLKEMETFWNQRQSGDGLDDVIKKAKKVERAVLSKIEEAFNLERKKHGKEGKGLYGEGIFSSIKRAIKKAPQAFAKAIGVKPTDSAIQAFVKGLKSPLTLGEKFEKATGISIPAAAEKLAPMLASAAALNPALAPLLLPASAAILAGGEGFRALEAIDNNVLKKAGFGFK